MARNVSRPFSTISRLLSRSNMNSADVPEVFLPPINRLMRQLDRAFFKKTIPLAALTITDVKKISPVRTALTKSGDLLHVHPIKPLRDDPANEGAKCILLRPEIEVSNRDSWSSTIRDLTESNQAQLRAFELTLTYDDWTMHNILEAILPELPEDEKETPAGFAQVGHVAHLNLRGPYLPFKTLIGQVLLDKNPIIKTVINKTLDVGTESAFRTFPYEVLAGPDDLDVIVHESGCEFHFNFGKVYWNSRLGTEHARVVSKFQEGQAVCDVMAGVGPFAIPAGKQKVFVRANDLNPDSFQGLQNAVDGNKVGEFVLASCEDGRAFIRGATTDLSNEPRNVVLKPNIRISRDSKKEERQRLSALVEKRTKTLIEPRIFDHYVMNLPATAIEFLDAFRGTYTGRQQEFVPHTTRQFPMIHLYLFQAKLASEAEEHQEIIERIAEHLGITLQVDEIHDLELYYVRLVAPKKKMYCASFRLPAAVAFADQ